MVRITRTVLFTHLTRLAREVATHVVADRGPEGLLRRGVTTTVTGALKEGLCGIEHELGVYSQGVKAPPHERPQPKSVTAASGWPLIPGPLFTRAGWEPRSTALLCRMGTSFTTMPEPHEAICSEQTAPTLNLVAAEQEHVDGPRTRSWIGRTRWMR